MKIGWALYNMLSDTYMYVRTIYRYIYILYYYPQKWFHNNELMKIGPDGVHIFSKITWTWIMELNARIAFCTIYWTIFIWMRLCLRFVYGFRTQFLKRFEHSSYTIHVRTLILSWYYLITSHYYAGSWTMIDHNL